MIPPLPFPEADPCIRVVWVQFQHCFPHLVVISVATVIIIVIIIILVIIIVIVIIVIVITVIVITVSYK